MCTCVDFFAPAHRTHPSAYPQDPPHAGGGVWPVGDFGQNGGDPSAALYSILNTLRPDHRFNDQGYVFKLVYPGMCTGQAERAFNDQAAWCTANDNKVQ